MDAQTPTAQEPTQETQDAGHESSKRRQILDGARRVFLADGFDGASMNDIARVAGVSKGTLYVYFDSKEALFEALIREDRKQQAEQLVFCGEPGDARECLSGFGRRLVEMMTRPEMIAHLRIVIAATGKFPSLGRAFYESGPCWGVYRLAERLERWREDDLLQFDDSRLGRVKELVASLRSRLEVAEKLVNAEVYYHDEIPVDKATPENIVQQVTEHFETKK